MRPLVHGWLVRVLHLFMQHKHRQECPYDQHQTWYGWPHEPEN